MTPALSTLDEVIAMALGRAAALARPDDGDKSFLERRLSRAVVEQLEEIFDRQLVREGKKLAPSLPGWNPQPGAIDVAVVTSDHAPRLAFELKVDDVERTLWDLFKMVAATETPACQAGYLVCAMSPKGWESRRDCVELFREPDDDDSGDAEWYSCFLFREYSKAWADLLGGGTGCLTDVAESVFVTWLGRWAMAHYPVAWSMEPSTVPAAAMFTCAIACHCDLGDLYTGQLIAGEQPDEYRDVKFARAACRRYAALLAETGEERWKRELDRHVAILDAADAPVAAA